MGLLDTTGNINAVRKVGSFVYGMSEDGAEYESAISRSIGPVGSKDYKSDSILSGAIKDRRDNESPIAIANAIRRATHLADTLGDSTTAGLKDSNRQAAYVSAIAKMFKYDSIGEDAVGQLVYAVEGLKLPPEQLEDQLFRFVKIIKENNIEFEDSFAWMPLIQKEVERLKIEKPAPDYAEQIARDKEYNPGFWASVGNGFSAIGNEFESMSIIARDIFTDPVIARSMDPFGGVGASFGQEIGGKYLKKNLKDIMPQKEKISQQDWQPLKQKILSIYKASLHDTGIKSAVQDESMFLAETELDKIDVLAENGVSSEVLNGMPEIFKNLHGAALNKDSSTVAKRLFEGNPEHKPVALKHQEGVDVWKASLLGLSQGSEKSESLEEDEFNELSRFYRRRSRSLDLGPAALRDEQNALGQEMLKFGKSKEFIAKAKKAYVEARESELRKREANVALEEAIQNTSEPLVPKSGLVPLPGNKFVSELQVDPATKNIVQDSIGKQVSRSSPGKSTTVPSDSFKSDVAFALSPGVLGEARLASESVSSLPAVPSFFHPGVLSGSQPIASSLKVNMPLQSALRGQTFSKPLSTPDTYALKVNADLPKSGIASSIVNSAEEFSQVNHEWQVPRGVQFASANNVVRGTKETAKPDINNSLQRADKSGTAALPLSSGAKNGGVQNGSARNDAGKVTGAKAAAGNMTIHYNPTFNLPESAAGLQALVKQASQMALADFERLLQRSNQGKARQEYGVV